MSDELKVCPFCGGDARIHSKVLAEGFDSGYWAVCDECGKGDTLPHESEEEAAADWNARAERTCRIEWRGEVYESEEGIEEDGSYFCTACDQELTGSLAEAWDDYQAWGYKGEQPFRNCPNCGAKIEGESR